jgi:hypothetical protein
VPAVTLKFRAVDFETPTGPGSCEKLVAALYGRPALLLKGNEISGRRPPLQQLVLHSNHGPGPQASRVRVFRAEQPGSEGFSQKCKTIIPLKSMGKTPMECKDRKIL